MTRKIAAITTSRADYSHLYWVLKDLEAHPNVDLQLIATAAHLAPDFGRTVARIESDGFQVAARVGGLDASDDDAGMARTIGALTTGLADVLAKLRPDLLLLIADRYELLAPASVALALRIPVAHIEGGDVSQGAVDDAVRNAVTKLAHVHFAPTAAAAARLEAMGEERWRIHQSGAPSLDHLRRTELPPPQAVAEELQLPLDPAPIVVAYHPVTIARDTLRETDALFEALEALDDPVVFCFPNADAGSRRLAERAGEFCAGREAARLVVNLAPPAYWTLLKSAALMLGNSSSGIMETASVALPTVNIGMRQQGRERAANVIDAPPDPKVIREAVEQARSPAFRESLVGLVNPYGDGRAAGRIVRVLTTIELGEALLIKRPAGE